MFETLLRYVYMMRASQMIRIINISIFTKAYRSYVNMQDDS